MNKELAIKTISNKYALLTYECEQELIDLVKILRLKKATILVREGTYSDKSYYIINGCARAYYLKDGKDVSDWFAFENDFISAIVSFFTNHPSPHFIELLEDSVLIEFTREQVEKLSAKYHDF